MSEPRVTFILPAFNAAATIARAIASIRGQTFPDWKLIVIDDGSTDATGAIVRTWAAAEPRIRLLEEPHRGIVAALNRALGEVRSPLVARMDADDESLPKRLVEQVAFLDAHRDVDLVGCLVQFGGDLTISSGYSLHVDWINSLVTPEMIRLRRFVESPFAHPSVLFRRELVDRYGGYREGPFPEDYELWLRWLDAGVKMGKVPKSLLIWNDLPGRLSRKDPRYELDAFYRCKAVYLARWVRAVAGPLRPVWVWGAGRLTRRRVEYLAEQGIVVEGFIDVDDRKIGRSISGRPVVGPRDVPRPADCFVLCYVAKRGAREFARTQLTAQGFVEGVDFVAVA